MPCSIQLIICSVLNRGRVGSDGTGNWVVRGGFGIYNNWLTQVSVQEEFRGIPRAGFADVFRGRHSHGSGTDIRPWREQQTAFRVAFPHFKVG